jgi:hypothetical protein
MIFSSSAVRARLKDVLDQFASRNKAAHRSFRCAPQQGCGGRHRSLADARQAQHPADY